MRFWFAACLAVTIALPAYAITELEKISFKKSGIELQFFADGSKVTINDSKGWVALRVLTILLFQEQVEQSYQQPLQTGSILASRPKYLEKLAPPISATLQYLKDQPLTEEQSDLLSAVQESEIFRLEKDRKRTVETILNNKLKPLLESEPLQKTLVMTVDGKKIEKPFRSNSTADFITYELTNSQLKVPITQRPRTSPEITWSPQKIIFQY